MPKTGTTACPECGAQNRQDASTCRLCGTLLKPEAGNKPRIQKKMLRRTDFLAAARANQTRTNRLVFILLIIACTLGYLVGWNLQMWTDHLPAEAAHPVWFLSGWGILGGLLLTAVSSVWTIIAFRLGDRIVMRMTGAHEASLTEARQLHNVVEEMALAAGIPKPRIYIIDTDAMNAFATGMQPSRAAIGVTRGLLESLDRDELQGVIGHEMGHVVNWDIRYATAVSVLVGLIILISDGILRSLRFGGGRSRSGRSDGGAAAILFIIMIIFAILAPLVARLVQMAVSRQREFLADATSVRLTRNPHGLISALEKLGAAAKPFDGASRATQHLFIVNPFRNFSEQASALMSTHPPLQRRIQRLLNLGAE